jgi:hypothetical protein
VNAELRVSDRLFEGVKRDLERPHAFAAERVGFMFCSFDWRRSRLLILPAAYHAVADEHYVDDDSCGAMIDGNAFREALQVGLRHRVGLFHVHMHAHCGVPQPSPTDLRETAIFVPDFFHIRPDLPHGALILSRDRLSGRLWQGRESKPVTICRTTIVGLRYITVEAA